MKTDRENIRARAILNHSQRRTEPRKHANLIHALHRARILDARADAMQTTGDAR